MIDGLSSSAASLGLFSQQLDGEHRNTVDTNPAGMFHRKLSLTNLGTLRRGVWSTKVRGPPLGFIEGGRLDDPI